MIDPRYSRLEVILRCSIKLKNIRLSVHLFTFDNLLIKFI
ncbi:hypothetical protein UUU_39000 [Klebsiella pneumoniae subsp. pneumoniae DSM 30104 = JCM 1662 = NBRC 14940]|nr:hypothetical protein UUU_39000 [Klebsiella pneumoniae subsp. pneumoniae DSM 30104 = JCM 1662 = NBRC 14940]